MDKKKCPVCGSVFFLSSRRSDRIVFQVDNEGHCIIVDAQGETVAYPEKPEVVCCGACSWNGDLAELAQYSM